MKEIIQFFVAIFLGVLLTLAFLSNNPCMQIKSDFKIKPEYHLTTDGKTIDTIWIYKSKLKDAEDEK